MGNYPSWPFNMNRHDSEVENITDTGNIYKYPPKSTGSYFADNFVMAGEHFDNSNIASYLCGENSELNYLTNTPFPFPYPLPKGNEPSEVVEAFIHLRKDSLRLVKVNENTDTDMDSYRVEFVFDTEVNCSVRVFIMAKEEFKGKEVTFKARKAELQSEKTFFGIGTNQSFSSELLVAPGQFQPSELNYIIGSKEIPVVVQITAEDPDFSGHSESTFAGLEKLSDGSYMLKFMKQKIMIDGLSLIVQELYGIENKNQAEREGDNNDDVSDGDDDDTMECVICMSNIRDTLILPCRHLCLCIQCASVMKNQQSKCPICRANFHALLQITGARPTERINKSNSGVEATFEKVQLIKMLSGDCNKVLEDSNSKRRSSKRSLKRRSESTKSVKKCNLRTSFKEGKEIGNSIVIANVNTTSEMVEDEKGIPLQLLRMPEEDPESEDAYLEASLPGTPMDSDNGSEFNGSVLLNSSKGSQIIAKAQVTSTLSQDHPVFGYEIDDGREGEIKETT